MLNRGACGYPQAKFSLAPRQRASGVLLIDHLVGLALALIVSAGASALLVHQVNVHRQLQREAALSQALHQAHNAALRELRRAGHWAQAERGLAQGTRSGELNPYDRVTWSQLTADRVAITYAQSDRPTGALDHGTQPADHSGLRLRKGAIDMMLGEGNWQQLTDPAVVTVSAFNLALAQQPGSLHTPCATACVAPAADCVAPGIAAQGVGLRLEAHATRDTRLQARLQGVAQLRNDSVRAGCASPP